MGSVHAGQPKEDAIEMMLYGYIQYLTQTQGPVSPVRGEAASSIFSGDTKINRKAFDLKLYLKM